jgi:membrane protein
MARSNAPDSPGDMQKRSWFGTAKRSFSEFKEDNVTDWAAALTYYGVLALFPAIIALISIVGLVMSPDKVTQVLTDTVGALGPQSAVETFSGTIDNIANSQSAAGIMVFVGIALALWSASSYVGAFMRASNAIYERDEGRPFWKLRPLQLLVTLILVLLAALVVISLVVTGPVAEAIGGAVGLSDTAVTVWQFAKWPVMLVVVMFMLAVLYWSSPNAKQAGFRWVSPGAVLAVIIWIVASAAFAFYVATFSSYNKTYGALAGVVVFLIWLWITNIAILLGAEINAETERSREIEAGVPGAENEIQAPYRDAPKGESERQKAAQNN